MAQKYLRLDEFLREKGYFETRSKAQAAILAGMVSLDGKIFDKPGYKVNQNQNQNHQIQIKEQQKYVSRGAYKLQAAHQAWNIDFESKIIMDIGSSTGGFCDYALQAGAKHLIAIDVGKAQLDYKLRQDPRLQVFEQTDFRNFDPKQSPSPDLILIDVSFISILAILKRIKELQWKIPIIALFKPQFEASKSIMDKCKGVIKDSKIREKILQEKIPQINDLGFILQAQLESPIKGAKGNIEYLFLLV